MNSPIFANSKDHRPEHPEPLDDRQKTVLKEVCKAFIETGTPVGSRTLSRSGILSCSPATIRNEMADLEIMGYLTSPHTSAGRVPTEKGYRFYVNFLIKYEKVNQLEEEMLGKLLLKSQERHHAQQDILKSAIKLACEETQLAGIAISPRRAISSLKSIRIFRVLEDKAMLVLIDELGNITDQLVTIPAKMSDEVIEKLGVLLNAQLCHSKYHLYEQDFITNTQRLLSKYNDLLRQLVGRIKDALSNKESDSLFLEGFVNFFEQPEFNAPEKMKKMISLLDHKESFLKLLAKTLEREEQIMVNIGSDSGLEVKDLSVVTAKYEGPNKSLGQIGLIGPLRMDYGRVVATLSKLSTTLSKLLISETNIEDHIIGKKQF
jgi:heat-inducible transcriptional repressor